MFINTVQAQLCQGSLGDPVVNITFGQGSTIGPELAPGVTNYNFVLNPCPNDGQYTIANSTTNCFSSTWHTVTQDHTPNDVNGYMMVVNASSNPGQFFIQTVSGLCGGTTYEFASWIMNVLKNTSCLNSTAGSVKPNVTFQIETNGGTILHTFNSGDIPVDASPVWLQYGAFFTLPLSENSVVIRMINNAPGGCGNDLLLDDITFRACGSKVTADIGSANTKSVCSIDTAAINIGSSINPPLATASYQWQVSTDSGTSWKDIPGAGSASYKRLPSSAGIYQYRLAISQGSNISVPSCRIASNAITINVIDKPVANAGPDQYLFEGKSVALNGSTIGNNLTYYWTPNYYISDVSKLQPLVSPPVDTTYKLTVVSVDGCGTATDNVYVGVLKDLLIPNAFSPNGDGINDEWNILGLTSYPGATVTVFNRYGQQVFTSFANSKAWNGKFKNKVLPVDTYYYVIDRKNGLSKLSGWVVILR